jgi:hypothetical protein
MEERQHLRSRREYCRSARSTIFSRGKGIEEISDSDVDHGCNKSDDDDDNKKGCGEINGSRRRSPDIYKKEAHCGDDETTKELKEVLKKLEDIAISQSKN